MKYLLSLLLLFPFLVQAQLSDEVIEEVKKRVESEINQSIAIAYIMPDGTEYYSIGLTEPGGSPVDEHSIYEIGSITKTFTGLLLAIAQEEQKTSVNTPIPKYLKKIPEGMSEPITLGRLSDHTSGLPRMPSNFNPVDPLNPYAFYTTVLMRDFIGDHEMRRDVGSEYEYSNLAQGLLGSILADIYETTYEELVIEKITNPLEMDETRVTFSEEMKERLAQPFDNGTKVKNWDIPAMAGAGAIRSSTSDMAKYIRANMGQEKTDLYSAMKTAQTARHDKANGMSVGLGWHIRPGDESNIIWHNGGTGGYKAFAGFNDQTNIGVVVLTNCTESVDDLGFHILDDTYALASKKPKVTFLMAKTIEKKDVSSAIEEYKKVKSDSPNSYTFLESDINSLGYRYLETEQVETALAIFKLNMEEYPKSWNVYDSYAEALMKSGDNEKAIEYYKKSIDMNPGNSNGIAMLKKLGVEYTPEEIVIPIATLETYLGVYELMPGFNLEISLVGEQLMAQATGQPKFPIFPKSQSSFYLKVVEASLDFNIVEDQVESLTLYQGGQVITGKKLKK